MSGNFLEKLDTFFLKFKKFRYKKRQIILFTNDTPPGIYYIVSGYVRSFRVSKDGKELTVSIVKPGDMFPMLWLFNNTLSSHYYESMTDVELIRVPKETLLDFLQSDFELFSYITKRILVRLNEMTTRLETSIVGSAREKVAAMLVSLSESIGKFKGTEVDIMVPFTHQELATLLGLSRETVSVELDKLRKEKLIDQKNKTLRILKLKKLTELLKYY